MIRAPIRIISLGLIVSAAWLSAVVPAHALSRVDVKRMVVEQALDHDVPPSLALAVAKVESNFDDRALSPAGARGVMQIMPRTAESEFDVQAERLWDAETNIRIGVRYLKQLHAQYGQRWELALSHYNGGTLNGSGNRARPHAYTRRYIEAVMKWRDVYDEQNTVWLALMERGPKPTSETAKIFRPVSTTPPASSSALRPNALRIVEWLPDEAFEDVEMMEWEVVDDEPLARYAALDRRPPPRHHRLRPDRRSDFDRGHFRGHDHWDGPPSSWD